MKTSPFLRISPFLLLLLSTLCNAQINPPEIEWQKSYWLEQSPFYPYAATPRNSTGEDWFYDLRIARDHSTNQPEGFICAGYTSVADHTRISSCGVLLGSPDCDELETSTRRKSFAIPKMAELDLEGHQEWYKMYGKEEGWFNAAIGTSDGGYLAVGVTVDLYDASETHKLYYNPTSSAPTQNLPCSTIAGTRHIYVVKTDDEGNVEWNNIYGMELTNLSSAYNYWGQAWDVVEMNNGNFKVVGDVRNTAGVNKEFAFIMEIEPAHGYLNSIDFLFPSPTDRSWARKIAKLPSTTTDEFVIVGNMDDNGVMKGFCHNPSVSYTTTLSNFGTNGKAYDAVFSSDGKEVLIGGIVNCTDCGGYNNSLAHGNGEGTLWKIDNSDGSVINSYPIGYPLGTGSTKMIKAYDLKVGVTYTADGGFAAVSTVQQTLLSNATAPYPPCSTTTWPYTQYDKDYWNTDGYIVKFNSSGAMQWERMFDNKRAAAVTNDFPEDIRKEECLYRLVETPDGGLVAGGNEGANFDDDYVVKVKSDCDSYVTPDITDFSDGVYDDKIRITANTTWNSSHIVLGSVHVEYGVTLTITGSSTVVEFADSRRTNVKTNIVIEPGGKVIINGATLTSFDAYCPGSTWDGILVEGSPNASQSYSNQGVIEIDGATIKHALDAIATASIHLVSDKWVIDRGKTGGGIVKAEGAHFLNNWHHVVFYAYHPNSSNNVSYFRNCTLEVDGSVNTLEVDGRKRTDARPDVMVVAWEVKGVCFTGCEFKNTNGSVNADLPGFDRGTGIFAYDASLIVNADFVINSCDINRYGIFHDLSKGIVNYHGVYNIIGGDYRHQKFDLTDRCVELVNGTATIHKSDFNLYVPTTYYNRAASPTDFELMTTGIAGIVTKNAVNFHVEENTFSHLGYSVSTGEIIAGTVFGQSGSIGGMARKNVYLSSNIGVQTQLANPNLQISCNYLGGIKSAIKMNPLSVMSATPKFGECNANNAALRKDYGNYFLLNSPYDGVHVPSGTKTYVVIDDAAAGAPTQSKTIRMSVDECFSVGGATVKDGCVADTKLEDICGDVTRQTPDPKKGDYYSNKSSKDAAVEYLNTEGLNEEQIAQGESDLAYYTTETAQARGHVLWTYNMCFLYDTTGNWVDSIITFLIPETDLDSRKILIATLYYAGKDGDAISYLDEITSDDNDEETSQFINYYNLLLAVRADDRDIFDLSEDEWNALTEIASTETSAAESAKGIFSLVKGQRFDLVIERAEEEEEEAEFAGKRGNTIQNASSVPVKKAVVIVKPRLGVYPNPANGVVTVGYKLTTYSENIAVKLADITGRILAVNSSSLVQDNSTFNTTLLAEGMYFVQLFADDKLVSTQKLIIQH